ncbi:hypothetical protein [Marinobacter sp.]|uniref:hypothetical protein n=1 Tax=Marinobacter sp. TaxID=50741 RepID=UPI003B5160F5
MSQVSPNSFPQGIIAKGHTEKNFQFLVLSGSALALIQSQLANLPPSQRRSASRALFYFECFLWLIKHPPITSALDLRTNAFLSIQRLFYGALYSTCFLAAEVKYSSRQRLVLYFFKLLAGLSKTAPIKIFVHSDLTDSQVRECIAQFESIRIDPARVAKLTGWHVADRSAGSFRLKMGAVFDVLGTDFTSGLHQESQKHALAHSHYGNYVNVVSRFDDFVCWYDEDPIDRLPLSPEVLQDPIFVYQFFWSFQRWHFEGYTERRQSQPTERVLANLQRQWIRIICWAKSVLVRGGLMCSPLGEVWPEGSRKLTRSLHEVGHHRYADGEAVVSQKLLTQIPLSVTDKEATELLFKRIEDDFNKVVRWARRQIDRIAHRLNAIDQACDQGDLITLGSRISSRAYGQPLMAMNSLIRTVKETHNGFTIIDHAMRGHLVSATGVSFSTAELAANLAMPTKYAIAPIAIWLVAQQPVLTDASLLACELFDRNGKRTGFVRTDSGSVLVVKKNRKGKQQEVVLSDDAASVVELLIQITSPVRSYLKEKGDDAWRRLFIVAGGQGFQEPYTFTSQTGFAKTLRQKAFVQAHSGELGELINTLSLARIRATAGVLVYLDSLSIEKMAESLGNSKRVAMNHYLPPTIMQFFQERWVRIFQNAVIVHAMKDSPFLLDATDFNSMSELDRFLEAHALRPLPEEPDPQSSSAEQTFDSSDSEIVISIDEGVLGVLLSLKLAVEKAGPRAGETAVYWSEFAAKVESHIESDDFADPYIRSCLEKAREVANPQQYEGLVCG